MKRILLFSVLVLGVLSRATGVEQLSVYPPVPGLDPSPHYSFRVRQVGSCGVQASGAGGATGVALVEVYLVP